MAVFPNEITKCNYEVGLDELLELITISDFVAIDCTVETTGFLLPGETFNADYMSDVNTWTGDWYDTIKTKEKSHCLLEVGVAVFKRIPFQSKEVEVEVFNIPVLPACVDDNEIARFRGRTSVRVQIDGYGQDFIKKVNFDVNKVFYMATPYLNRQLQEQADMYMKENPNFMVAARKRRLNRYLMPQLYEEVSEKERKIIIHRLKGFTKVFEMLAQSGIPVVGHHLLLKLIFMYKDFFEYLPDTYPEWVNQINSLFKVVYDTKQLAWDLLNNFQHAIPSCYFERLKIGQDIKLYELVRNLNNTGEPAEGFTLNIGNRSKDFVDDLLDLFEGQMVEEDTDSFCYVAGFDALTCGILFLDLVHIMEKAKLDSGHSAAEANGVMHKDYLDIFLKGNAIRFRNKLYQAPILPDQQSIAFLEWMQMKKEQLQWKREKEENDKKASARKPITTIYNLKNTPLKIRMEQY